MSNQELDLYEKYKALYLANDKRFLRFSKNTALGIQYKRLLNARVYLRNKQWNEAVETLNNITTQDPYIKGEKLFLLGSAHLYLHNYHEAILACIECVNEYKIVGFTQGIFNGHYNASVAYENMGQMDASLTHLEEAEKYLSNNNDRFTLLRALACYHSGKCEFDTALIFLERAAKLSQHESDEIDKLIFETVYIETLIKAEKYEQALVMVKNLYQRKLNRERYKILYYKNLLESLLNGKNILPNTDLQGEILQYSLKWDLLALLQTGDKCQALEKWNRLVQLFPGLYAANFEITNESEKKTLFGKHLNRILKPELKATVNIDQLQIKSKIGKRLIQTLLESKFPVRKEDLIEDIWNTAYEPNFDARFYKLIERLKKQLPIKIQNTNNAYQIQFDTVA